MMNGTKNVDAELLFAEGTSTIESISLVNSDLTDAGIKSLMTLPKLRRLSLQGTQITDAGIKQLCALKNIVALNLKETKITEAVITDLETLPNLQSLTLSKGQLSAEAKKKLGDALPSLRFY